MSATTQHPKVFISYSWSGPEHEQFVIDLTTALRGHGVDAILDKWDLQPGQDKYVFMESMVNDPGVSRVLVICDRKYQEKADARAGGVGTESQIISAELYGSVNQTKFIPVVCEYDDDGKPCLPTFMKARIYVDISTDERYGEGLDQLLRHIYEQPLHEKPSLGAPPVFTTQAGISYTKEFGAAVRAIQDGKPNKTGLETLFLRSVLHALEKQYSEPVGNDYFEGVYQNILATKGLRDQLSDYCEALAASSNDEPNALAPIMKLLESIGSHFEFDGRSGTIYPGWLDFYRYFALELVLILTAALLRHSRWKTLRRLLSATYIVRGRDGQMIGENISVFDAYLPALDEHRNTALNLRRVSVSADLLKERCSPDKTTLLELQEADFLLTLAITAHLGKTPNGRTLFWVPRTGVYLKYGTKLPLFLRATDEFTRAGILHAIGIDSGAQLKARLEEAATKLDGYNRLLLGHFNDYSFLEVINASQLTR